MKNVIKSVLTFLFVSLFISCSNDTENLEESQTGAVPKNSIARAKAPDFEYLGIEHNKILDDFYNDVVQNNISSNSMKQHTYNFIEDAVSGYNSTAEDKNLVPTVLEDFVNNINDFSRSFYKKQDYENNISSELKSYLDDLHTHVYDSNANVATTINNISLLESDAESNLRLNNTDLAILFSATNTARYTLLYWENNIDKWYSHAVNIPKDFWGDMRDVGGADVGGAIGGAVYAAAVNAIPGAGQAAYGSTIIASAAGASAATAAVKIWNSLWD